MFAHIILSDGKGRLEKICRWFHLMEHRSILQNTHTSQSGHTYTHISPIPTIQVRRNLEPANTRSEKLFLIDGAQGQPTPKNTALFEKNHLVIDASIMPSVS